MRTLSSIREAGRQASGRAKLQTIDTSGLENHPNLSPEQSDAFATYKQAKRRYDAFVAKNAAMVARMDRATGSERDELLMDLRRRKAEEQPLVQALGAAQAALLQAFPNDVIPARTAARPAPRPEPPPVTKPKVPAQDRMPKPGKDGVVLIDVSGIERSGNLSEVQTMALRRYKSAGARYRRAYEKPHSPEPDETYKAAVYEAKGALRRATFALLNAFPEMSFK